MKSAEDQLRELKKNQELWQPNTKQDGSNAEGQIYAYEKALAILKEVVEGIENERKIVGKRWVEVSARSATRIKCNAKLEVFEKVLKILGKFEKETLEEHEKNCDMCQAFKEMREKEAEKHG